MKSAQLQIPYLILSSVVRDNHFLEQRVQTPIGSVDIRLRTDVESIGNKAMLAEMLIEADIFFEDPFPAFINELYKNLANFSYDIARQSMILQHATKCVLSLKLKGSENVRRFIRNSERSEWLGLDE